MDDVNGIVPTVGMLSCMVTPKPERHFEESIFCHKSEIPEENAYAFPVDQKVNVQQYLTNHTGDDNKAFLEKINADVKYSSGRTHNFQWNKSTSNSIKTEELLLKQESDSSLLALEEQNSQTYLSSLNNIETDNYTEATIKSHKSLSFDELVHSTSSNNSISINSKVPSDTKDELQCEMCGYKAKKLVLLKLHKRVTHKSVDYEEYNQTSSNTNNCNFRTDSRTNTTTDSRIHKQLKDSTCSFTTACKSNVSIHSSHRHVEKLRKSDMSCIRIVTEPCEQRHNKIRLSKKRVKPYVCNKCDFRTVRNDHLIRHMRTHIEKLPKCAVCTFETDCKSNLVEHLQLHAGDELYICDTCSFNTIRKDRLIRHMITHIEKVHHCYLCKFKTAYKFSLVAHLLTHTGNKPYVCNTCNFRTVRKDNLNRHMKVHPENLQQSTICKFEAAYQPNLLENFKLHAGVELRVKDTSSFHTKRKERTKRGKRHQCTFCSYETAFKFRIVPHLQTHTEPYVCDKCDFTTIGKASLKRHMKIHGEELHKCTACRFETAYKSNLIEHFKSHRGDELYVCHTCSFNTIKKDRLIRHMGTHVKKMYWCSFCKYKTTYKFNLGVHLQTHVGDKPYVCETCDFRTLRKDGLKRHMQTHREKLDEFKFNTAS